MDKTKFKQTELGMIPEDWVIAEIGNYLDKIIDYRGKTPKKSSSGVITLSAKSIKNGKIDYSQTYFISQNTFKNWETRGKPLIGDVLVTTEGPLGEVAQYNKENVAIAQRLILLRGKKDYLNNNYLLYYLMSFIGQSELLARASGSTVQGIKQSELKKINILLPSLPEQKTIAKILSDLDEKIELNRKMNQTLEEIGKTLFKRWFVDFEFPNEKGEPYKSSGGEMVYNDKLKKEIPKGWTVDRLDNQLVALESGKRPKGGASLFNEGIPSIGAENISGLGMYDYNSTKYVPEEFFNNMHQGIVKNGDVLLYKDGASLGRKTMFMCDFPFKKCCINEHVFILRSKEKIGNIYLYFWLDQNFMTDKIIGLNTNSAQPGITKNGVYKLPILVADNKIIMKFNSVMIFILQKIFFNCIENQTLSETRDSLLPKLMSGKIRVNYE